MAEDRDRESAGLCGLMSNFSAWGTHNEIVSIVNSILVGALEHGFYDCPIILGMSSSQLTFTPSFFRGVG